MDALGEAGGTLLVLLAIIAIAYIWPDKCEALTKRLASFGAPRRRRPARYKMRRLVASIPRIKKCIRTFW